MANLDPWYVTGFCDGEAAFTYSRGNGSFGLYFSITQRDDNRQIVEDIRSFFNCIGNIYHSKGSFSSRMAGHTQASAYYRVTRVDELTDIVQHFDKYPLQSHKKHQAYAVWREMVLYKEAHFRDIKYDILRELAAKLSRLNSKSRAFKVHTH